MENLRLAPHVLEGISQFFFDVTGVYVQYVLVRFPTWTSPFRLTVRGVAVDLQQCNMPKVVPDIFDLSCQSAWLENLYAACGHERCLRGGGSC